MTPLWFVRAHERAPDHARPGKTGSDLRRYGCDRRHADPI